MWGKVLAAGSVAVATLVGAGAWAQQAAGDFPTRTVTLVGYSAAGGPVDLLARLLADGLKAKYSKPVIVENRTGAAGVTASLYVKGQPADGHTLLYGAMTTAIFAPQIRPQQPYDTRTDFTPVALTIGYTLLMVASPSVPFNDPSEMVAYAKANPGKLNYGTNGFGSWTHIAVELFLGRTGIKVVHVPYTGNAPAMQAVLAGDIQLAMVDFNLAMQHIQEGKLKVIGQLGAERAPEFPNVPTFGETVPELTTQFWLGVFGPPAMPKALTQRLNGDINEFMQSPAMKERAKQAYMTVMSESPEAFAQRVEKDWTFWGQVVREKGLMMQ
ncbi:MAG: tripartite tricarboxylate transporter substrate binding protein [Variibacter sp.]|nr:tripartite tricarboxylate transporter substrate binding protein [Variibacter sp.]